MRFEGTLHRRTGKTTVLLTLALAAGGCGEGDRPPTAEKPPTASPAASGPEVRTKVGAGPSALVAAYGSVWSADHGGDSITGIDPSTAKATATYPVKGEPTGIAAGFGSLWTFTPMPPGPALQRVDADSGKVVARIRLRGAQGGPLEGMVRAAGAMWVAADDGYLNRIDPRTNRAERVLRLPEGDFACPGALARAGGGLWFTPECGGPHIVRIDLRRRTVTDRIRVRDDYAVSVTAGGGSVWAVTSNGSVLEIDPKRRQVVKQGQASDTAERAAFGAGALWVRADADRLVRVDPETLEATRVHRLPEAPVPGGPLTVTDDAVWAGNFGEGSVWRLRADR